MPAENKYIFIVNQRHSEYMSTLNEIKSLQADIRENAIDKTGIYGRE